MKYMKDKKCYIIGAGDFDEKEIPAVAGDLIIAADGGWLHLDKIGIIPDLIIADFDSSPCPQYDNNVPQPEIIIIPSEKDDSDTFVAVKEAFSRGFSEMIIYGGTGGRFDHTMANIAALHYIVGHGGRGKLIGRDQIIECIMEESCLRFELGKTGYISVFAWGGRAEGVTLTGLKYPLDNAVLTPEFPLGLSNEFVGEEAEVRVVSGCLVVVYER